VPQIVEAEVLDAGALLRDVTVFVDPSNTDNAVLEPGGSNLYPVFVVLSAITLMVGVLVLLT
jgi:hypothetical protein